MKSFETSRTRIEPLGDGDTAFIIELLNDPSFIQNIGDRKVRTVSDALGYISKITESYRKHAFGLMKVTRLSAGVHIVLCGLIQREVLDSPDIGFAFLPAFQGKGYAFETAQAVILEARSRLGLRKIAGVVDRANLASVRVLEKLGMSYQRDVKIASDEPAVMLYLEKEENEGSAEP
jgi:RimJ/RimL family protein N-acetyltransferase